MNWRDCWKPGASPWRRSWVSLVLFCLVSLRTPRWRCRSSSAGRAAGRHLTGGFGSSRAWLNALTQGGAADAHGPVHRLAGSPGVDHHRRRGGADRRRSGGGSGGPRYFRRCRSRCHSSGMILTGHGCRRGAHRPGWRLTALARRQCHHLQPAALLHHARRLQLPGGRTLRDPASHNQALHTRPAGAAR